MPVTHEIMSTGEALFWYLSLPVLIYAGLRFALLNLRQCARLDGEQERAAEESPQRG